MIDFLILVIDILAILGFSRAYCKQIKGRLKNIAILSILIPIVIFIAVATKIAIYDLENYWILIGDQLVTLILGIITGGITSYLTDLIYNPIKELVRHIKRII